MSRPRDPNRPAKSVVLRVLSQVDAAGVQPLDPLHLVALLEMEGWNDSVAQQLGYSDLFALARATFPAVARARPPVLVLTRKRVKPGAVADHFWRGLIHSAPTLLAIVAALLARRDTGLGRPETAVLALAMWGSFLISGGFHQMITDRGKALLAFAQPRLALRFTARMVSLGVALTAALSLGLVFAAGTGAALLYGSLALLWLSVAVLTVTDWLTPYLVGLALLGAGLAAGRITGGLTVPLPTGVPGLAVYALAQTGINLTAGFWRLRRLAGEQTVANVAPQVPTRSLLPSFLYGLLFFLFLLSDRFLIWTHALWASNIAPATQYETALVWAGLVLALSAGVAEVAVQQLTAAIYLPTAKADVWHNRAYARSLIRRWFRLQAGLLLCLTASAGLVFASARWAAPLAGHGPLWVLAGGLVGHVLLGSGLFQLSVCLATNQIEQAINLLFLAAGLNLACGLIPPPLWQWLPIFADTGGYPPGIPGFVAGSLLLWLLGARVTYRTLRRMDYVLYANA